MSIVHHFLKKTLLFLDFSRLRIEFPDFSSNKWFSAQNPVLGHATSRTFRQGFTEIYEIQNINLKLLFSLNMPPNKS